MVVEIKFIDRVWEIQFKIEDWFVDLTKQTPKTHHISTKKQKSVPTDSLAKARRILALISLISATPMVYFLFTDYLSTFMGINIIPWYIGLAGCITFMYLLFVDFIIKDRPDGTSWFFEVEQ